MAPVAVSPDTDVNVKSAVPVLPQPAAGASGQVDLSAYVSRPLPLGWMSRPSSWACQDPTNWPILGTSGQPMARRPGQRLPDLPVRACSSLSFSSNQNEYMFWRARATPREPVVDEFELFPLFPGFISGASAVFFLPAKVQEVYWSGEKFFHERSGQEIGKGFSRRGFNRTTPRNNFRSARLDGQRGLLYAQDAQRHSDRDEGAGARSC